MGQFEDLSASNKLREVVLRIPPTSDDIPFENAQAALDYISGRTEKSNHATAEVGASVTAAKQSESIGPRRKSTTESTIESSTALDDDQQCEGKCSDASISIVNKKRVMIDKAVSNP